MAGRPKKASSVYKEKRSKRAPYKRKQVDTSGKTGPEYIVQKSFWTENKMTDIITLSSEELDLLIDNFLEAFVTRQIKGNKYWNFPDAYRMGIDLRKFR